MATAAPAVTFRSHVDEHVVAVDVDSKQRKYHHGGPSLSRSTHTLADVAKEFIRQYGESLCNDRATLHRFYGADSTLISEPLLGTAQSKPIVGQAAIKAAIAQLPPTSPSTMHIDAFHATELHKQSLLVHVVGTVTVADQPRLFSQSILLVPLGVKKYYLHTDVFVFAPTGARPRLHSLTDLQTTRKSRKPCRWPSRLAAARPARSHRPFARRRRADRLARLSRPARS